MGIHHKIHGCCFKIINLHGWQAIEELTEKFGIEEFEEFKNSVYWNSDKVTMIHIYNVDIDDNIMAELCKKPHLDTLSICGDTKAMVKATKNAVYNETLRNFRLLYDGKNNNNVNLHMNRCDYLMMVIQYNLLSTPDVKNINLYYQGKDFITEFTIPGADLVQILRYRTFREMYNSIQPEEVAEIEEIEEEQEQQEKSPCLML